MQLLFCVLRKVQYTKYCGQWTVHVKVPFISIASFRLYLLMTNQTLLYMVLH